MKLDINEWRQICQTLFTTIGLSKEDAFTIADAAVTADLRGVSSHGTARLAVYRKRLEMGLINKTPAISVENDAPAMVRLNGDNGLGQVVTMRAVQEAKARAKQYGSCCVSSYNTNHMGMLSYYALQAAKENLIAYIMCNTPPFVAAIGGMEAAIGTNPLCWAVPGKEFPIVMDMAISPARGKIKNAAAKGEMLPEGWALGPDGNPTTDAKAALDGVLLPIGGVKGYGMGIIVEAFSALLSGGSYGSNMSHPLDDYAHIPNCGNFVMLIDVEKSMTADAFKERVAEYSSMVKGCRKQPGTSEIFMPGEIEHRRQEAAEAEGMEVAESLYREFTELIEKA